MLTSRSGMVTRSVSIPALTQPLSTATSFSTANKSWHVGPISPRNAPHSNKPIPTNQRLVVSLRKAHVVDHVHTRTTTCGKENAREQKQKNDEGTGRSRDET